VAVEGLAGVGILGLAGSFLGRVSAGTAVAVEVGAGRIVVVVVVVAGIVVVEIAVVVSSVVVVYYLTHQRNC